MVMSCTCSIIIDETDTQFVDSMYYCTSNISADLREPINMLIACTRSITIDETENQFDD